MSNNVKKVLKLSILMVVVLSLMLWLMPMSSLMGIVNDDCQPPTYPYDVHLKSEQLGDSWDAFDENCSEFNLQPGDYGWHLVLGPLDGTASATINGVPGVQQGSNMDWLIINTSSTALDWIAVVTAGLQQNTGTCEIQTELRVSHTCYGGGNGEETGSITICKTYTGAGDPPANFNFTITGPNAYNNSIQVAPEDCETLEDLEFGDYTVTETDIGYDVVITGDANKSGVTPISVDVTINENDSDVTLYFDNDPVTIEELGTIGVEKVDEDGEILTGAGFTLYNSDKSVVVVAEQMVDAAGKVAFKNLPLGTYIVSETTVPEDYEGMADISVTIDASNVTKVVNVIATNSKEGPPPEGEIEVQGMIEVLAFTGYNMVNYIVGLALVLIGIIGSVYLTRMLRKKNN